jgi:hypothetical protein
MPDLGDVTARIKAIPPWMWVVGAAVIVAVFILSRGSGGSSDAGVVSGGTGGAGGDFSPDQGEQIVALADELRRGNADLSASIKAQGAANTAWQAKAMALLSKPTPGATPGTTTVPRPGTVTRPTPSLPKPAPTLPRAPTPQPVPAVTPPTTILSKIIGYTLSITQATPLYSSTGARIGTITKGTYQTQRVKVGDRWRYVITSGARKGQFFYAQPWFKTVPIIGK